MATKKPVWGNRQWVVTSYGIEHLGKPRYVVPKNRLAELRQGEEARGIADWPPHLAEKNWVDTSAFLEVFGKALEIHKPDGAELINLENTVRYTQKILEER